MIPTGQDPIRGSLGKPYVLGEVNRLIRERKTRATVWPHYSRALSTRYKRLTIDVRSEAIRHHARNLIEYNPAERL
jgi:hypothetical protein